MAIRNLPCLLSKSFCENKMGWYMKRFWIMKIHVIMTVISQWGTASISESKSSQRQEPFVETGNPPLVLVVSWNLLFIRSPRVSVSSLGKLPFRTVLFSEQTLVLFSINSIFFFYLEILWSDFPSFWNSKCQRVPRSSLWEIYIYLHTLCAIIQTYYFQI